LLIAEKQMRPAIGTGHAKKFFVQWIDYKWSHCRKDEENTTYNQNFNKKNMLLFSSNNWLLAKKTNGIF